MYVGIDVHKRYPQVAVMDETGEIVEEVRVENANLDDLAQRYAGAQAVLEATSNYYHDHDTLSEHLDVTVANRKKITQIADTDIDILLRVNTEESHGTTPLRWELSGLQPHQPSARSESV